MRSAVALYFALLATSIVGIIAILGGRLNEVEAVHWEFWIVGVQILLILGWTVYGRREVAPALKAVGGPGWYGLAVLGALGTFALAFTTVELLARALPLEQISYSEPILTAGYGWAVVILMVCVEPAVFEELAFRGVVLSGLRRVLSTHEAVVVSSLMFMTLHLAVLSFPHLLVIGLALGYLRVRTGSLYPGVLLHFTHNLLCVLAERWGW